MEIEQDKKIYDLLTIEKSIYNIYNNLVKYEIKNNDKKYQENIEFLKIAIEIEEKIYNSLNINRDDSNKILNRIYYLNTQQDNDISNYIVGRIESIFCENFYSDPFLSNDPIYENQLKENSECIICEFGNDFTSHLLNNIEERIKVEQKKEIREELIILKYDTLYLNKSLENILLGYRKKGIYSRERCLLFNQNEKLVNMIYRSYLQDNLNTSINIALNITDKQLEDSNENNFNQMYQILIIKSSMELLTEEEKGNVYYSFYKSALNKQKALEPHASKSLNEIMDVIKSFMTKDSEEIIKIKEKTDISK